MLEFIPVPGPGFLEYETYRYSRLQQESNVAAIAKTARTNFVLACQSICTPEDTDPVRKTRSWYNLIGEAVQSLYGLLFEQSSPSIPVAITVPAYRHTGTSVPNKSRHPTVPGRRSYQSSKRTASVTGRSTRRHSLAAIAAEQGANSSYGCCDAEIGSYGQRCDRRFLLQSGVFSGATPVSSC